MPTHLPLASAVFSSGRALVALFFAPLLGCGATAEPLPLLELESAAADPPRAASYVEEPAGAIFVSPVGNDDDPGSRAAPVMTFARAVALARPGERHIVLCAGTFSRPLELTNDLGADAFSVTGGASCLGFPKGPSVVRTTSVPALHVFAVAGPTRIERITFERADAVDAGASSIAAHIAFVDDVRLTDVTIRAGNGSPGAMGGTAILSPCAEPPDPRVPTHIGHDGKGAAVPGYLSGTWVPESGHSGGILRFPRSSRCVEAPVAAGAFGGGGGASIGLVARLTHLTLVRSVILAQDAANGGSGGSAQAPTCDPAAQKSCEVLDIGGGGGGAGGVSTAVLHRQTLFDMDAASRMAAGGAGLGGNGGQGARWLHGTAGIAGISSPMLSAEDFPETTAEGTEDEQESM